MRKHIGESARVWPRVWRPWERRSNWLPRAGARYASQGSCFATASVWEIAIGGQKMVGSAQCREGGAVLQAREHLLRSSEERLASLLKPRGPSACSPAAPTRSVFGRSWARKFLFASGRRLEGGPREGFGFSLFPRALSGVENARALKISRARYENEEWTLAR